MATTIETADITLIVDKREDKGTNPSGRLRAEGRVPAVRLRWRPAAGADFRR